MAEFISTLGVKLDSSGVERGVRRIRSSLNTIPRTARTATAKIGKSFDNLKAQVFSLRTAVVGLGTSFIFAQAIKGATEFEAKMFEVSTLLDDTSSIDGMADSLKRLSESYGLNRVEQAQALYQAISAGAEAGADAVNLLNSANKLAIGGVTSVEIAVDGLTTAMNVYAAEGLTATEVSDALFVAMRAGKTTVEELSSSLGLVLPIAREAGLTFDETAAAVAALTKSGITTRIATTGLRAIMATLAKPTQEAGEAAEKLGIDFSLAGLRAQGFGNFLDQLQDIMKQDETQLTQLFGNVEAIIPILNFAGSAGVSFNEIMESMGEKAGQTDQAFSRMSESAQVQFNKMKQTFSVAFGDLGEVLLPTAIAGANSFSDAIIAVREHTDEFGFAFLAIDKAISVALIRLQTGFLKLGAVADVGLNNALDSISESVADMLDQLLAFEDREFFFGLAKLRINPDIRASLTEMSTSLRNSRDTTISLEEELERIGKDGDAAIAQAETRVDDLAETLLNAKSEAADLGQELEKLEEIDLSTIRARRIDPAVIKEMQEQRRLEAEMNILATEAMDLRRSLRTAQELHNDEVERYKELLKANVISEELYARAVAKANEELLKQTEVTEELNNLGEDLGLTFASAFEDALVEGKNLGEVLKGLEKDLIRLITRLTITEPLARGIANMFNGGGGGGGLTGILGSIIGAGASFFGGGNTGGVLQSVGGLAGGGVKLASAVPGFQLGSVGLDDAIKNSLPNFAEGGTFTVGGRSGVDNNVVAFNATKGETVTVTPKDQGTRTISVVNNFHISAPDGSVSRASQMQVAQSAGTAIQRALQRNQ